MNLSAGSGSEIYLILTRHFADKPEYKAKCMYQRFGLLVLISAGCALFASIVAYKVSAGTKREPPAVKTTRVVAAASKISAGTAISEKQLKLTEVPENLVPAGAFLKIEDVKGRSVTNTILAGEPITSSRVGAAGAGWGLAPIIAPGSRAIAVRVNDVIGVSGFVLPGMRVDVLATGKQASSDETMTRTVLQNLLVLSAGQAIETEPKTQSINTAVVTLQVTPHEAEIVTQASTEGKIQLVLRNSSDSATPATAGTRANEIYGESVRRKVVVSRANQDRLPREIPPATILVPPSTLRAIEVIRRSSRSVENVNRESSGAFPAAGTDEMGGDRRDSTFQ